MQQPDSFLVPLSPVSRRLRRPIAAAATVIILGLAAAAQPVAPYVVIHGADNDPALRDRTLEVVQSGLREFEPRLPVGDQPIHVYIARHLHEFDALFGDVVMRRIQGFAKSREGLIVIKAPSLLGPQADYDGVLRHELLHVLLSRNTDPANLPRWLNEGIAMMVSRENRWTNSFTLGRMYVSGDMIEYRMLPFVFAAPGNETEFGAAYVQSLSMTHYLRNLLSEERFWAMLRDLRERPFSEVLEARTGLSGGGFYEQWYSSLWKVALIWSIVSGLTFFQVMAILVIVTWFKKRRRGQQLMEQWKDDEDNEDIVMPWELEGQEVHSWEED